MDITSRRLWIIKQLLETEDDSLLKKIEYLLLTHEQQGSEPTANEPVTHYQTENNEELIRDIIATIKLLKQ